MSRRKSKSLKKVIATSIPIVQGATPPTGGEPHSTRFSWRVLIISNIVIAVITSVITLMVAKVGDHLDPPTFGIRGPVQVMEVPNNLPQTEKTDPPSVEYNSSLPALLNGMTTKARIIARSNSSNFEFICPSDRTSEYIDLELKFFDRKLVEEVACIVVTISVVSSNNATTREFIFNQFYEVRYGLNRIRLRNHLRQSKTELTVGYFLKTEIYKEYPFLEQITCKY